MKIAEFAHEVLSREQRRLKPFSVQRFDEKWIQFLIFRELLLRKEFKQVEAEYYPKNRGAFLDLFVKGRTHNVAIEIKGPANVTTAARREDLKNKILRDARKLHKCKLDKTKLNVLALVHGSPDQVQEWVSEARNLNSRWTLTGDKLRPIYSGSNEVLALSCFKVG